MQIDSYDTPSAEALLAAGEERLARFRRERRELLTNCVGALAFLAAASSLALASPWHRSLSVEATLLVIAAWIGVLNIRFPVAGGFTYPTLLVFVPALFVLPTPVVPLVGVVALLLRRTPDFLRGNARISTVPGLVVDAWYTLAPAGVIVAGGAQHFAWARWPIYACALVAQILVDIVAWLSRSWFAERITPRLQMPMIAWTYAVDAALAPLGLIVAAASVQHPGLLSLEFPVLGLFALFARERQQRLDAILELSTAYRGTTLLLGDIIEADDSYTGMHSRDVVDLSLGVADALGLDPTQRRNVEFGALLHDVGKIRIPKETLNKRGPLDAEEWRLVRRHTIDGEAMLRQVGGRLAALAPIVRASHERWDGAGYPDGIAGEQIPIEARIIAACDAYNAMMTDRPYRDAIGVDEALLELTRGSGSQFDPQVVAALERRVRAEAAAAGKPLQKPQHRPMIAVRAPRPRGYTALSARL